MDTGAIMEQVKVQIAVANAQELLQVVGLVLVWTLQPPAGIAESSRLPVLRSTNLLPFTVDNSGSSLFS
ncbi:uncharacterized [Tachysurus ichikawai]